ncbi:MAG: pyridoxamine 5'-phosphate oxidase, partial [Bacteroidota bacterium]
RVVLLKGIKEDGLVFYTNYEGAKAQAMAHHPKVSLTFFWAELERQVQVKGTSEKLNTEESLAYFHSRPRGSQIGAWASPQSQVIDSRTFIEERVKELEEKYENQEIPLPPHWGGYLVKVQEMEFWQGRPSRLHDRIVYRSQEAGQWIRQRLAP